MFTAVLLRIAWVCYQKPIYNWDTLAYMAVVLSLTDDDTVRVHHNTYRVAREEIPDHLYALMVDTTHALKKTALNSPAKFFRYTSFFRIKPAFTGASFLAYRAGAPLSKAPMVPSMLSFVGIAFVLLYLLSGPFDSWVAALLSLSIIVSPPMLEAARGAMPDALSALVILIYFCLILKPGPPWLTILILILSILIRLDNIIFAVVAVGYQFLFTLYYGKTKSSLVAVITVTIGWIAYAVWAIDFYKIDVAYEFYGGVEKMINPGIRIKEIAVGFNTVQTSHLSVVVVVCAVVLFYNKKVNFKNLSRNQHLFLMLMIYSGARYVLFPNLTTRFFLPVYLMAFVLLLFELRTLMASRSDEIPDPASCR